MVLNCLVVDDSEPTSDQSYPTVTQLGEKHWPTPRILNTVKVRATAADSHLKFYSCAQIVMERGQTLVLYMPALGDIYVQLPIELFKKLDLVCSRSKGPCVINLRRPGHASVPLLLLKYTKLLEVALVGEESAQDCVDRVMVNELSREQLSKEHLSDRKAEESLGYQESVDRSHFTFYSFTGSPAKRLVFGKDNARYGGQEIDSVLSKTVHTEDLSVLRASPVKQSVPVHADDSGVRAELRPDPVQVPAVKIGKCKCKVTQCQTRQCGCHKSNIPCSQKCKCVGCKNPTK